MGSQFCVLELQDLIAPLDCDEPTLSVYVAKRTET